MAIPCTVVARDTLALTTDILLPVGGILALTGVIMLIVNSKRNTEQAAALEPTLGPHMAGVSLKGRF